MMGTVDPQTASAPRANAPRLMLAAVCDCARAYDIATITITYDGAGDEGQIDRVSLAGPHADGEAAPEIAMPHVQCTSWTVPYRGDVSEIETSFESAIEDLGYEFIAQYHSGWENGEGAFGELVIDVVAGKATLEHSTRFVDTDCSSYEWEC
jgi:hypothetical protein